MEQMKNNFTAREDQLKEEGFCPNAREKGKLAAALGCSGK
jgi:hypothetical protein